MPLTTELLSTKRKLEDECIKQEFILENDNYGKITSVNGLFALARMIQTLFLIIPGTYPNHPSMGIGIQLYKFEYLDKSTLDEIRLKAKTQIRRYIPNSFVSDIEIQKIDDMNNGRHNSLGILVNLNQTIDGTTNVIITFDNLGKTGQVMSEIYI